MDTDKTHEIVLTGGPCGGKTTGLAYITEKLLDRGVRVFTVPEVATEVILGGVRDMKDLYERDRGKYLAVQKHMLWRYMRRIEEARELAGYFHGEPRVIISDRGALDMKPYVPEGYFEVLCEELKYSLCDMRDRSDLLIHMVTAANGAEKYYTLSNNKARRESPEEARIMDRAVLRAWEGHPHIRIIDNTTPFEEKVKRSLRAVSRALGIPVPLEIERKYLIRDKDMNHEVLKRAPIIDIEQMYLIAPSGEELRIRKRSQGGSSLYFRTWKKRISGTTRHEIEHLITPSEYYHLQEFRDPSLAIIQKKRYCFTYENQYFELDLLDRPTKLSLLEVELTEEHDTVILPQFLEIVREVTGEPEYSNYEIARRGR